MLFYLNTVFRILLNVKTWFILSENSFEKKCKQDVSQREKVLNFLPE